MMNAIAFKPNAIIYKGWLWIRKNAISGINLTLPIVDASAKSKTRGVLTQQVSLRTFVPYPHGWYPYFAMVRASLHRIIIPRRLFKTSTYFYAAQTISSPYLGALVSVHLNLIVVGQCICCGLFYQNIPAINVLIAFMYKFPYTLTWCLILMTALLIIYSWQHRFF